MLGINSILMIIRRLFLIAAIASALSARAELTIDKIMRGHALTGWDPTHLRWSADGSQLFFDWKQADEALEKDVDTWVVKRDGSGLRRMTREEAKHAPPANGSSTPDHRRIVYEEGGDIYLFEDRAHARRALTSTSEKETKPRISRDGQRVTFIRDENLFLLSLEDGSVTQLTNIGHDFDDLNAEGWPEKEKTASQKFVAEEERKLLDVIERAAM